MTAVTRVESERFELEKFNILLQADGMKGGIAVSETDCMATTILQSFCPLRGL
jgi:hypothetical protein